MRVKDHWNWGWIFVKIAADEGFENLKHNDSKNLVKYSFLNINHKLLEHIVRNPKYKY